MEDLSKFLKREYKKPKKRPTGKVKEHIKEIAKMYILLGKLPIVVEEIETKKKIKVDNIIQGNTIIEDNIDHFTTHRKLKYKISHI